MSSINGIPPRSRNHRDPTAPDTPHAIAASSLVSPSATFPQNARSMSRRIGGLPGDRIAGRPVTVVTHPACRPIPHLLIEVLRRPIESTQDTSIKLTEHLELEGIRPSIGSVGDAYDDALMETINGLYKTECIRTTIFHPGAYKTLADVEYATAGWVDWYNHARLHGSLGMITPAEYEHAHHAALNPVGSTT